MEHIEVCWEVFFCAARIARMGIRGYFLCRLTKPFFINRKHSVFVGAAYFAAMLVLYFIPFEMDAMLAYAGGMFAAFAMMYFIDRRNLEQKLFLGVVMYLLNWISYSIAGIPRDLVLAFVDASPFIMSRPMLLFACYAAAEIFYDILVFLLLAFLVHIIDRVYVCKRENMSWKELGLMLAAPCSVLLGYGMFHFISNTYLADTGKYIQDVHPEYKWIQAFYQIISYIAIIAVIVFYQNIKESHRKEKENAVLSGQIENVREHIREVEALYRDLRGLRHDMGNHVAVLENLVAKNEWQEAAGYLSGLKEQLKSSDMEIKSGNPVTDIILTEKRKEAEEKGIDFVCDFHYPQETKIDSFDVSVILNNALSNAIEAAEKCSEPYVRIKSYRERNAYMIEVSNRFSGQLALDEESGLPGSSKTESEHGFGLVNIRKVAQKYFGGIDIGQDGDEVRLSVMLMVL